MNSLKHEKPVKECFDIQARGPGHLPGLPMVNFECWTLAMLKPGKRSSDIVDWSHAFTLRKVLNQWFLKYRSRVAKGQKGVGAGDTKLNFIFSTLPLFVYAFL